MILSHACLPIPALPRICLKWFPACDFQSIQHTGKYVKNFLKLFFSIFSPCFRLPASCPYLCMCVSFAFDRTPVLRHTSSAYTPAACSQQSWGYSSPADTPAMRTQQAHGYSSPADTPAMRTQRAHGHTSHADTPATCSQQSCGYTSLADTPHGMQLHG